MSRERREWLDDEEGRRVVYELKTAIDDEAKKIFGLARTGTLEEIRRAAWRRDGLMEALRAVEGDEDEEEIADGDEDEG